MTLAIKTTAAAIAIAAAGGAANAALLDFTDDPFALTGSLAGTPYTITGFPEDPKPRKSDDAPGPIGPLLGENDGLGIINDEVTGAGEQYITIDFMGSMKITAAYFLDLFIAPPGGGQTKEVVEIYEGVGTGGALLATFTATEQADSFANPGIGYGALEGVSLVGTTFTFAVGSSNDKIGREDFALAGIEASQIPLPAGVFLLGGALAGLGIARRRK